MGHWSMHIEGAGIHDNERDDDADAMLKEFAGKLAEHHKVDSVTFTVGSTRELLNEDDTTPLASASAEVPLKHVYRHRAH